MVSRLSGWVGSVEDDIEEPDEHEDVSQCRDRVDPDENDAEGGFVSVGACFVYEPEAQG